MTEEIMDIVLEGTKDAKEWDNGIPICDFYGRKYIYDSTYTSFAYLAGTKYMPDLQEELGFLWAIRTVAKREDIDTSKGVVLRSYPADDALVCWAFETEDDNCIFKFNTEDPILAIALALKETVQSPMD